MRTHFKTPKGTELPILDMKGKEYLQVAHRLVWFREERPDWSIETDFVEATDKGAKAKAIIRDEAGRIRATAHKTETAEGFPDFEEKAETGAVGRALAFVGYGTQFAPEIEEGDNEKNQRLADSPTPSRKSGSQEKAPSQAPYSGDPADYVMKVGRSKGQALKDITPEDLAGAVKWAKSQKSLGADWKEFLEQVGKMEAGE